jgi:SAM-dependent methyltransferase
VDVAVTPAAGSAGVPEFVEIDGIRCYAPEVALGEDDYPTSGFDVTAEVEARSFWCRTRNRILRRVFDRFVDRDRSIDVLEIGCGIGGVLRELRHVPNVRLTGSEIYLAGLRYAHTALPDINFIQLDATKMPFREEFDVVGAFDVLEHIKDDEHAIRGVHQALKPAGLFVVTVPQYPWMWSRLDEIVRHKRRYSRSDLVDKLEGAGFVVMYVTSFVTTLFPLMLLARLRSRQRAHAADDIDAPDDRAAFAEEVILPGPINWSFDKIMRIDELALRLGFTLPFGGSLLVVARRR